MKKIATMFFLIISITAFSQEQFFVGKNAELLIGKKVTVKEGLDYCFSFFTDSRLKKLLFSNGISNDLSKLAGLEFTVTKTIANEDKYSSGRDVVLVLENGKTGTVYYAYDSNESETFLLNVVGGLTLPEGLLCNKLLTEKDKFSAEITRRTPNQFEYSLMKVQENGKTSFYLILQSYGVSLNVDEKGLKVLFSDGTVMSKPDIEIKYSDASGTKGWTYSCIINLDETNIDTFITKTITDYSLGIYERKMNSTNALELREYLKCMTK